MQASSRPPVIQPLWAVWRIGSTLVMINEVNLHRARLVLGWVTVSATPRQFPVPDIYLGM